MDRVSGWGSLPSKFSLRALVLGWLADFGGTTIGMFLASLGVGVFLAAVGVDIARVEKVFAGSVPSTIVNLVFGLAFTALGGYVTARLAWTEKLRHALGMGFMSELTGFAYMILTPRTAPLWYYLLSTTFTLPVALLGGFLGMKLGRPEGGHPKYLFRQILLTTVILAFLLAAVSLIVTMLPVMRD